MTSVRSLLQEVEGNRGDENPSAKDWNKAASSKCGSKWCGKKAID